VKEHLFKKVEKPYKKAFKKHQDSLFQTLQSKLVMIDEQAYVLVGEERLLEFPLISHFDVFDAEGRSAPGQVAEKVHNFFAYMIVTDALRPVEHSLEHINEPDEQLMLEKIRTLIDEVDKRITNERISSDDVGKLEVAWHSFWELYQPRANRLLETTNEHLATNERAETETIKHIFTTLSLSKTPKESVSMQSLIHRNYTFGRFKQEDDPIEKVRKGERGLYNFLKYIYRVLLVLIVLIIVVLLSENDFHMKDIVSMLVPIAAGYVVKQQSKTRLQAKTSAFLGDLRLMQEPIAGDEPATIRSENHTTAPKTETAQTQTFIDTKAIMLNHLILPSVFAGIIFLAAGMIYFEGSLDATVVGWVVFIGGLFVGIAVVMPLTPLAKNRLLITDHELQLRKEKFSPREVVRVVLKENGKTIQIFVNSHAGAHNVRIIAGEEERVLSSMQSWCAIHQVPFERK